MCNLKPYAILLKAVKIGEKNFGELLVICQICQSFLLPMFFTIRYSCYRAAVVIIDDGGELTVEVRCITNLIRVIFRCISHYFHFNIPFKQLYTSNKKERFSYKGGCSMHECMHIEVLKRRAGLGYR